MNQLVFLLFTIISLTQAQVIDLDSYEFQKRYIRNILEPVFEEKGFNLDEFMQAIDNLEYYNATKEQKDTKLTPDQVVKRHGLQFEYHKVVTEDQYILTHWRVWNDEKVNHDKVIMMQHGLIDDAFTWLVPTWENTLVKLLTDNGYELWLLNSRGTRYSFEHQTLNTKEKEFWNFTFHEMGKYDQPANVEYIKTLTGVDKISAYIGHSQGTIQMFAQLCMDPEFENNFKSYIMLGPVIYADHQSSPAITAAIKLDIVKIWHALGWDTFLYMDSNLVDPFIGNMLKIPFTPLLGINAIQDFVSGHGKDSKVSLSRFQQSMSHYPGGTSFTNMLHWIEIVETKNFVQRDFKTPYNITNLKNLKTPMFLMYGQHDMLANPTDVERLLEVLPADIEAKKVDGWGHLDFTWSDNINKIQNQDILEHIIAYNRDDKFEIVTKV